nr:retrovirus-related Pol polyprotein from transposon TNT 1-94 [Tanacetum cinerariifolium]
DFVHFSDLDTFSSVRRPKNSGVMWNKKGSSNTSNVGLMNDLLDDNNFFIFYDVNVRTSPVSKMPFRKKPRDSMNIVQICPWIIYSGCSKHMTGYRALLTNFVEKFLGTVLFGNNDFAVIAGYGDVVIDLDTFSSVRRPKNSGVIWKKKGSSNTSNVGLSAVSVLNLNKNVKRYSGKDLLACNNSHLGETSSASVCNDAMNVSCNSRMNDLLNDNNFFIFDDESVRISPVSKMPFRKKPRCSKHMTGNHALLMNFVEKFLGTIRFGDNDFVVIAGYGDVVIGSMTIKKVYYVVGLRHNLFSAGQFCDKGLEVTFRKSTCFVRNKDGVDLLIGDCSSNLYTIALNEDASNSSTCLLVKAFSSQSWLWHQHLSHLNFATINNLVKNNLVQGLPKMKFEKDHLCSACEQGKIHRKHHKSKMDFASNKPLYLLYMDLCGPMRVESINGKRYVLVVVDGYSRYTWVFFLHSKDEASEVSESFQVESSSSSLNDDVQQSPEEVILPQTNTQSISNNMIPIGDEASTSHNMFNERLEDAYFDASTSFHDPSNVHTYYQPYPHEKKWTKDHLLHKIIALKDADWVSAMQDELDQFARLKVW